MCRSYLQAEIIHSVCPINDVTLASNTNYVLVNEWSALCRPLQFQSMSCHCLASRLSSCFRVVPIMPTNSAAEDDIDAVAMRFAHLSAVSPRYRPGESGSTAVVAASHDSVMTHLLHHDPAVQTLLDVRTKVWQNEAIEAAYKFKRTRHQIQQQQRKISPRYGSTGHG